MSTKLAYTEKDSLSTLRRGREMSSNRSGARSSHSPIDRIQSLQRTLGNQTVLRLVGSKVIDRKCPKCAREEELRRKGVEAQEQGFPEVGRNPDVGVLSRSLRMNDGKVQPEIVSRKDSSDSSSETAEACNKRIDNDVKGCQAKANTACTILGAGIAGIGATIGAFAGPIGAGIGAVAGGMYGAKESGECMEEQNRGCEEAGNRERKEKCPVNVESLPPAPTQEPPEVNVEDLPSAP
ncbi:hypothetical protein LJ655_00885 [Paraburkholderia sp. MMS20-SJTN17]|uniref:Uncharacterized protein n=1 Tax=Paraburkholderia translucens TaxID=2886945 RepID=A0ABS8K6U2_9BURK|nr:hypothetical protein [Paraburkholderia sp. MMS20-SJTN17]MCC8400458.1 hypothetical protein [Paraburkholderia sp. MMS20-SJTN17]